MSDANALHEDIEAIAQHRGDTTAEVQAEMALVDVAVVLQDELSKDYPAEFGGLFISEETRELTVAWKGDLEVVPESLQAQDVTVVSVMFSEEELVQTQTEAVQEMQGLDAEVWTDITTNQVVIEVDKADVLAVEQMIEPAPQTRSRPRIRAAISSPVKVVERDYLTDTEKAIVAGKATTTCSSGFTIKNNSTGTRYLTTAGHCGPSQTFDGTGATYVKEWWTGNYDIQIHRPSSGNTASPKFLANGKTRTVTGKKKRADIVVGSSVCKQGKTTGYTCGRITSKNASGSTAVNASGKSFVMVKRDIDFAGKISSGGDSGGPWFIGNVAYGWHHAGNGKAGDGSRSYFMTTDYIPSGYSLVIG